MGKKRKMENRGNTKRREEESWREVKEDQIEEENGGVEMKKIAHEKEKRGIIEKKEKM